MDSIGDLLYILFVVIALVVSMMKKGRKQHPKSASQSRCLRCCSYLPYQNSSCLYLCIIIIA